MTGVPLRRPTRLPIGHHTDVRLVAPDAVPEGAIILALVVAIPPADASPKAALVPAPSRQLNPVPARRVDAPPIEAPPVEAPPVDAPPVDAVGLVVDRAARRVVRDGTEVDLTRREFELLEFLTRHPDRAFSRAQLLSEVWEYHDPRYTPERTVDVHVSRLRRKLGRAHAAPLESLRGIGYRWSSRSVPPGGAS